jgi:phage-related protein
MTDYPCPECGYEGPHALLFGGADPTDADVYECGDSACACEFDVPTDREGGQE